LRHEFTDQGLLLQALTHRSSGRDNYERLEFLGDGLLNFVIAEQLYDRFSNIDEGVLSRTRASLVRMETLAEIARILEVGPKLRLGSGELKSGGFDRDSILSDAVEALVGAIYKDSDFKTARQFIIRVFAGLLDKVDPGNLEKDSKTRLQEYLQKYSYELPRYSVRRISGQPHNQHFVVECQVEPLEQPILGEGSSRRGAEQDAAQKAYERLTGEND
jgi:ribonuclease-3